MLLVSLSPCFELAAVLLLRRCRASCCLLSGACVTRPVGNCSSPEAKTHILACQGAMAAIVGDLVASSSSSLACAAQLRAFAANALWALLYNNQKAKAAIKTLEVAIRDGLTDGKGRMPVLEWLQQEHDALEADLAVAPQDLSGEELGLPPDGGMKRAGAEGQREASLLPQACALDSMRAALALALDPH